MRKSVLFGVALAFAATGAMAQTPPAQNGPGNSAVNTQNSPNRQADAPVKGSNSFTETEAKSRIAKQGFTDISDLKKDSAGVWRGHAMKAGQRVDVSLDFQGNVVPGGVGSTAPATATSGAASR
ncbi:MAG TPA: hypothetical protein VHY35_05330 [Stellaceae bacterium]|nr:hypothetical protein [Stellaceae bacterium]